MKINHQNYRVCRGLLTDGGSFTNPPVPYTAQHDTSPAHVLQTNTSGVLIVTLVKRPKPKMRKSRRNTRPLDKGDEDTEDQEDNGDDNDGTDRQAKRAKTSGKATQESPPSAPHQTNTSEEAEPSNAIPPKPHESHFSTSTLQSKTIKDLQAILKSWGLNISGRKDELITRILSRQSIGHRQ